MGRATAITPMYTADEWGVLKEIKIARPEPLAQPEPYWVWAEFDSKYNKERVGS